MDIRRRSVRFSQPADAFVTVTGGLHTTVSAVVLDISENGMRFMCNTELLKGNDYGVKIVIPISGATIKVTATILRASLDQTFGTYEYGASFAHMSPNDMNTLFDVLKDLT